MISFLVVIKIVCEFVHVSFENTGLLHLHQLHNIIVVQVYITTFRWYVLKYPVVQQLRLHAVLGLVEELDKSG